MLKKWYGMPDGFVDMRLRQRAAKFRVAWTESRSSDGAPVRRWSRALRLLRASSEFLTRRARWAEWCDGCFAIQLADEVRVAEQRGLTFTIVEDNISGQPRPWTEGAARKIKKTLQKTYTSLLDGTPVALRETRLREKLGRWPLTVFPRLRASRAARIADALRRAPPPPRVIAAIIRMWFNGWCTDRRYQLRGSKNRGCIWGCTADAGASIEH